MDKIFIIEDDTTIRMELCTLLKRYGYQAVTSDDFSNITSIALNSNADLICLDINLPFQDGYSICRDIRKKSSVPIIILTSRNTDMDELMAMNLEADDFITKPYNSQILLARISSILRRVNNVTTTINHKGLNINLEKGTIKFNEVEDDLTKNELKILGILLRNEGKVVNREDIMMELWQSNKFVDDNTLTVNINRLRTKLNSLGIKDFLVTKRGMGYII